MIREREPLEQYLEHEAAWARDAVEDGFFPPLMVELVSQLHTDMRADPGKYAAGAIKFMHRAFGKDLTPDKIGPNVRLKEPKIYIARLLVNQAGRGVGLSIVFSPNDPLTREVGQELYPRTLGRMRTKDNIMPFGALWADGYYFQGLAYRRGEVEGNEVRDSGFEAFDDFDQTYAHLHTDSAYFFRLAPPYITREAAVRAAEILQAEAGVPSRRIGVR